jgi:hypothetical protein
MMRLEDQVFDGPLARICPPKTLLSGWERLSETILLSGI